VTGDRGDLLQAAIGLREPGDGRTSIEALDGSPASWRWVALWAGERVSMPLRVAAAVIVGIGTVAIGLLGDVALRLRG
jgi:hypothetical protein